VQVALPTADEGFDPYEAFTDADSAVGDVRDPYPAFAAAREQSPVHRIDPSEYGMPADSPPAFTIYGYDEANAVLRDAHGFSSKGYENYMGPVMGHTILEMDGAEHHRHRGLVAQAFRSKALERWETGLIAPLISDLIGEIETEGHAELVRDFTIRFPMKVIDRILGLPGDHYAWFLKRSFELISIMRNWDRAVAASGALREYLSPILDARRVDTEDDLISELVKAQIDGHTLSDDEILPFLLLLLPAGAETTYRSTGNLMFGLLSDPDQLAAVRDDRALVPQAIEEALRWEPPLVYIVRSATRDITVGGVDIPEGGQVVVNMGAANRDPRRWDRPDEFDIHREVHPHISFASGAHACLGMHLARMEMRIAVNQLLDRLPGLALDAGPDDDVHIHGMTFRSPTSLPVRFDAR